MAQPQGFMLDDVVTSCAGRGNILHQFKQLLFTPLRQLPFQFHIGLEMIPDDLLCFRSDKYEFGDAGAERFFDACWIMGRSTRVNISLARTFVAGKVRVPRPATGNTALLISTRRFPTRQL